VHIEPSTLCVWLLAVNAATFGLYGWDKRAARNNAWRVAEGTLLLFALLGGSPAAFWASRRFRHKTKKASFRVRFWLIVALQVFALTYYLLYLYLP
jgi:uncharacterized membrane protein YsdA (DUF1294 family)